MTTTDTPAVEAPPDDPIAKRAQLVEGLRALADWLDEHPLVPAPLTAAVFDFRPEPAARIAAAVAADGRTTSVCNRAQSYVSVPFGPFEFHVHVPADVLGERREVTRTVDEWAPYTPDELAARAAATRS